MCRRRLDLRYVLMLLAVGLLWLGTAQAIAQTTEDPIPPDTQVTDADPPEIPDPEDPPEDPANAANPPRYITELMEGVDLTKEQVDQLRTDGMGWGEIRISALLAEQIAAASEGTENPLTFEDALAGVLEARAADKGYGEIAAENNLKVGQLVGNGNQKMMLAPGEGEGPEAQQGPEAGQTTRVTERKRGLLARIGRALGFGRKERLNADLERPGQPERVQKTEKVQKVERVQKMERVAKADRPERPSRPEKMEKPAKPERPERPTKLEKPERPERPTRPEKPEKPERPERPGRGR